MLAAGVQEAPFQAAGVAEEEVAEVAVVVLPQAAMAVHQRHNEARQLPTRPRSDPSTRQAEGSPTQ